MSANPNIAGAYGLTTLALLIGMFLSWGTTSNYLLEYPPGVERPSLGVLKASVLMFVASQAIFMVVALRMSDAHLEAKNVILVISFVLLLLGLMLTWAVFNLSELEMIMSVVLPARGL
jgi:hypothetical protein